MSLPNPTTEIKTRSLPFEDIKGELLVTCEEITKYLSPTRYVFYYKIIRCELVIGDKGVDVFCLLDERQKELLEKQFTIWAY